MAFSSLERSTFSGRPLQLYQFLRTSNGVDHYWRYNGADRDLSYLGNVYTAVSISDEGVRLTGEAASSEFQITLPAFAQFCDDYRAAGTSPSDTIYAHVFRAHADDISGLDTDMPTIDAAAVIWAGTVDGLTQTSNVEVKITCSMLAASFQRSGLRYTWQKNCPHMLYDPATCKVDKADFRVDATVSNAHGHIITADAFGDFEDGWFTGGFIEYLLPTGFLETRMINRHIGTSIRVLSAIVGMAVGDPIVAYPGCKRTVRACIDKFDNYDNYGGFPHIPGRSPYDGQPVF
jgi:uncharacterized phage protein (TIGR02218 family)